MTDEIKETKIGMYTTDEILEFMTNGEGRSFMGRSMYDAIIDYITNLQEEKIKIRKILIEHIEEARYELNVILQSDNDLNYKNECSIQFEILDKNIRMILDKIDNILRGDE